jgi:CubicO group peptidase (beta-lactamase class C family)
MAKSILGVLVGRALKQGYIKSLDQPVADFIPAFKEGKKSKITIKHLLMMSSGIAFDEDYINPLAYPAAAYYGSDLEKLTLSYPAKDEPGKVFKYLSGDSQLLAFVLKAATGKTVSEYAAEQLWKPIGAEHDALWNLDHENGWEKAFCCFYSNARDFARIGKLYKDFGKVDSIQLIDSAYVAEATSPNGLVDEDGKPYTQYGYQWWIVDYKGMRIPYMRGILGQYVFVLRDKNAVVVRLGHYRPKTKTPEGYPTDVKLYLDAALSILD